MNNVADIQKLAVTSHGLFLIEDIPSLIIPKDYEVRTFESLLPQPVRKKGLASLATLQTFIEYLKTYAKPTTKIFVTSEGSLKFVAIIDYHESDEAHWCDDRAVYVAIHTPEWSTWAGHNKKRFDQAAFAEFVEMNASDIVNPPSADILEMATNLSIKTEAAITSSVKLSNGNQSLSYVEESKTTGGRADIEVPQKITLGLSPYKGSPRYQIHAFLRIRIVDRKPSFYYELIKPETILDACTEEAIATVQEATAITLYRGEAR